MDEDDSQEVTDLDLSEAGLEPKERYLVFREDDDSALWNVRDSLTGEVLHTLMGRREAIQRAIDLNGTLPD